MIKCQNDHFIKMNMLELYQAHKVVCPTCEIVVKDREGPDGIYELKYADIKTGDRIPDGLLQNPAKLLQWFCPSLTDREAVILGGIATKTHLPITVDATRNLIEEQIPLMRGHKTEVGAGAFERLRSTILAIEKELGLSKETYDSKTISARLDALIEKDGSIKPEALASFNVDPNATFTPDQVKQFTSPTIINGNPKTISTLNDELTEISNKSSRRTINPLAAPEDYQLVLQPKKSTNGLTCNKCKQHYPYAEQANQSDGTFLCYGCKINY